MFSSEFPCTFIVSKTSLEAHYIFLRWAKEGRCTEAELVPSRRGITPLVAVLCT
jgi:hypothetical protein